SFHCLLLCPPLFILNGQWNVWVPRDVSAMTNSCVVIYFTFMYPYPHYKGRTKLIGDLHQRNCTLLISNIGTEHSLRYYFRADLDGANIYTYPDFSELKAHIDIPAEIVADDVGMLQHPPDNCPENSLEIQWMYTDYMPEPHYTLDYVEESNTAALSSTLTFTTKPMHNGRQTYCTTLHHPNSTYQSYLSSDATLILEESMCTVVREGVQCVFLATGNPEPIIEFYLPDKNINDTDGLYNYYMHMDGHMSMGMIKLREKGEQPGHCSVSNMYGSESFYLELQQEKKYMMAGIVGTIVGVAVIAFIIAAVRYVENGNPGRYLVSKLENPALYYSTVKKDKQCLRKKVVRHDDDDEHDNNNLPVADTIPQQLNVHFKVRHGEGLYAGFASTDSLRCFECGDLGIRALHAHIKDRRQSRGYKRWWGKSRSKCRG
uniref:Ig-like domain-containing protein n=1 Tax=Salmo trutta TaxID=8032 RepID=A0A674CBA8_SALTR